MNSIGQFTILPASESHAAKANTDGTKYAVCVDDESVEIILRGKETILSLQNVIEAIRERLGGVGTQMIEHMQENKSKFDDIPGITIHWVSIKFQRKDIADLIQVLQGLPAPNRPKRIGFNRLIQNFQAARRQR